MHHKLATLILGLGAIACILLTVRQQRIQAAHELAAAQRRVGELDRDLWRMRLDIASRLSPSEVDRVLAALGELHAIPLAPPTPVELRDLVHGPVSDPLIRREPVLTQRDEE